MIRITGNTDSYYYTIKLSCSTLVYYFYGNYTWYSYFEGNSGCIH